MYISGKQQSKALFSTLNYVATAGQTVFNFGGRVVNPHAAVVYRNGVRLFQGDYVMSDTQVTLTNPCLVSDEIVIDTTLAEIAGDAPQVFTETFTGNGVLTEFSFVNRITSSSPSSYQVYISGVCQTPVSDYTIDLPNQKIVFTSAVPNGLSILVRVFAQAYEINDISSLQSNVNAVVNSLNSNVNAVVNSLNSKLDKSGGNVSGPVNANKGNDLASAATVAIGAATGEYVVITGTTAITAFDTAQAGTMRELRFSGILTLTYNATSLILPTSSNIVTAVGDVARFRCEGGSNWRCVSYTKADGTALIAADSYTPNSQEFTASGTFTVPTGVTKVFLTGCGGGGGGGGVPGSNGGAQNGGGGGSGYTVIRRAVTVTPGASITVTVGGGGGAGSPGSGGTGGTTSFGALLSISGGSGGGGTNATGSAFNGGGGAGNWDGDSGSGTSNGGSSVFGRGALGGAPGAAAASNSGAGGGGGRTPTSGSARAGGAGGSGYLLVEW